MSLLLVEAVVLTSKHSIKKVNGFPTRTSAAPSLVSELGIPRIS
jgi:hypothetical protein